MKWSEEGSDDGQLSKPESVVVDSKDNVYVADYGNHRIQKFSKDGNFILKWGSKGVGDGEFNGPAGLSIDKMTTSMSLIKTIIGYKCLQLTEHF